MAARTVTVDEIVPNSLRKILKRINKFCERLHAEMKITGENGEYDIYITFREPLAFVTASVLSDKPSTFSIISDKEVTQLDFPHDVWLSLGIFNEKVHGVTIQIRKITGTKYYNFRVLLKGKNT